jgi:hypothetical protein
VHGVGYKLHLDVFDTGRRSRDRIPVGARFSSPVQTDPVPIGTKSIPGVKRLRRGVGHSPPTGAEVKKE